eukprot:COSAG02_NODE_3532_length_6604_cov_156.941071_3_plen_195_part_00
MQREDNNLVHRSPAIQHLAQSPTRSKSCVYSNYFAFSSIVPAQRAKRTLASTPRANAVGVVMTVELVAFTGAASLSSRDLLGSQACLHIRHATFSTVRAWPQRLWWYEWTCLPMGIQPASGFYQSFLEGILMKNDLLYTDESLKRVNEAGVPENFALCDTFYSIESVTKRGQGGRKVSPCGCGGGVRKVSPWGP